MVPSNMAICCLLDEYYHHGVDATDRALYAQSGKWLKVQRDFLLITEREK